jgi:hypothetical protein
VRGELRLLIKIETDVANNATANRYFCDVG